MAPWIRSSHMNQNRCCPGVPNMYSTRSFSSVIRPKSMATVVVFLSGTCDRSSTSVLATVMTASVVSGVISDTEPTKVVLPTPNPPATTIFTEVIADASPPPCGRATLDLTESTKHPFEQVEVGAAFRIVTLMDTHEAVRAHVRDQDARHPERQPEHRRDLGDGPPVKAELQDRLTFGRQHGQVTRLVHGRGDQGLRRKLVARLRPATGHGVRAHQPRRAALILGRVLLCRRIGLPLWRRLFPRPGPAGSLPSGRGAAVVTAAETRHRLLPRSSSSSISRHCTLHDTAARGRGKHSAGPLYQQGHLVGDESEIAGGSREHGQAGAVADRHDDQHAALHLHHGLHDRAPLEDPGSTLGKAGEARRYRSELIRALLRETRGERERQPVRGYNDRMGHVRDPLHEIRDKPAEVLDRASWRAHARSLPRPLIQAPRRVLRSLFVGLIRSMAPRSGGRLHAPRARRAGSSPSGCGSSPLTELAL